uniref:DUF5675 domain-containing protein n=1 Tax=Heterorhabditis bacteriophora TaxID=37862 RepID=A0A1I7W987_HETBA
MGKRFPAVWAHGDFCGISSKTGGVIMLGRSDATLNRGRVRFVTAEIYSAVETFREILIILFQNEKGDFNQDLIVIGKL